MMLASYISCLKRKYYPTGPEAARFDIVHRFVWKNTPKLCVKFFFFFKTNNKKKNILSLSTKTKTPFNFNQNLFVSNRLSQIIL